MDPEQKEQKVDVGAEQPDVYDELKDQVEDQRDWDAEVAAFEQSDSYYKQSLMEQVVGGAKEVAPGKILERGQHKESKKNIERLVADVGTASHEIGAAMKEAGTDKMSFVLRNDSEKRTHADYRTEKKQNVGAKIYVHDDGKLSMWLDTGLDYGHYDGQLRSEPLGTFDPEKPDEVVEAFVDDTDLEGMTPEQRKAVTSTPKEVLAAHPAAENDPTYAVVAEILLKAKALIDSERKKGGKLEIPQQNLLL